MLAAQYQQLILALWLFSTLLRLGSWLLCLWKLDVFIHSRYFLIQLQVSEGSVQWP